MIEYLRGILLTKKPLHIIVDAQGVGYGLDVPLTTLAQLPPTGQPVALFVHTHVQEDAIRLFGFATEQDRSFFEAVISVSGIGPKTALTIMSEMPAQELAHAIVTEDAKALSKIKGIGKKTAERMVLELHDKVLKFLKFAPADAVIKKTDENPSSETSSYDEAELPQGTNSASVINDAIEALVALDCKRPIAEKAVLSAAKELGAETELTQLVRLALRYR